VSGDAPRINCSAEDMFGVPAGDVLAMLVESGLGLMALLPCCRDRSGFLVTFYWAAAFVCATGQLLLFVLLGTFVCGTGQLPLCVLLGSCLCVCYWAAAFVCATGQLMCVS
jgi:hypothetical protein